MIPRPKRRVIVTVKVEGAPAGMDLEVSSEADAGGLVSSLAAALGAPSGEYRMEAYPPGRPLAPEETLAQAGAWDGAWLILRPS